MTETPKKVDRQKMWDEVDKNVLKMLAEGASDGDILNTHLLCSEARLAELKHKQKKSY